MLKQRVVTAVLLLLILLPALFYRTATPFCAVALVLIAAGGWEWARLNGFENGVSLACGFFCAFACALSWYFGLLNQPFLWPELWGLVGGGWVLAGAVMLRGGPIFWTQIPRSVRLIFGVAVLWAAWLAVAQARVVGINFLMSILLLVWAADIFAYFAGRAFGGRVAKTKLAPSISPGKSWEGVWGGMAGVMALALVWRWADGLLDASVPSFYSQIGAKNIWPMVVAVLFLTGMSVVGDLVESLVKRAAGAKDSSGLLPGHGGVLDRLDALLPTLPLALMLASVKF